MAVGGFVEEFDVWLNDKLSGFGTDESVFGSYIRGILEGEEAADEQKEALESILTEITEEDVSILCQEIFDKWKLLQKQNHARALEAAEDVDVKLARLMESQARATATRNFNYTDEEKRIREQILSQYGQYSDEEGDDDGAQSAPAKGPSEAVPNGLQRNTNATSVVQAQKEMREKAKEESLRKKEKDKEDREKQKQTQADKKEKRKTQKGERRR